MEILWRPEEEQARGRLEVYLEGERRRSQLAEQLPMRDRVHYYAVELASISEYMQHDVRPDASLVNSLPFGVQSCILEPLDTLRQQDYIAVHISAEGGDPVTCIAVIDDDQMVCELLTDAFADVGWQTVICTDPASATSVLVTARADVILLDVRFNGGPSGWDLVTTVKVHPVLRETPIIILSGDAKCIGERSAWLTQQNIGVIAKPFDLDELYATVRAALGGTIRSSIVAHATPRLESQPAY